MTLWLILTILSAIAAFIIAVPFVFRRAGRTDRVTGVDVYKDQLAEIERDLEQGMIEKKEADLARVEIERRLLNAARSEDSDNKSLGENWHYRTVTAVSAIVILGAIGIYATIGQTASFYAQQARNEAVPTAGTAQQTAQTAASTEEQQVREVTALIDNLKERLAADPEDADGWRVLGWSYYNMGDFEQSVQAYGKAAELQKDNALVRSLLGEAMVRASGGRVTPEALGVFEQVIALNPNDERARFFKGIAFEQKGDANSAIDEWIELYELAPADADWTGDLRTRIEELAQANNIDVAPRLASLKVKQASAETPPPAHPPATRGPSAEDIENASQMSAEDRSAMARGMVEGLAARLEDSPNDPNGWIMLMRSYVALNEPDKAQQALDKAMEALADSPDTVKQIADAAKVMGIKTSKE